MNALYAWLTQHGIAVPTTDDAIQAAIAGALAVMALALGTIAGRRLGPRVAAAWRQRISGHVEGVAPRLPRIVRHGSAALLLSIIASAHGWPPLAGLPLGLALGAAAALAAQQLVRGVGLPRWMGWLIAVVLFVALFSRAVGGLHIITGTLNDVGLTIGRRTVTLLTLIEAAITIIALLALVRVANRFLSHSIARSRFDPTQKVLAQKIASIAVIVIAFFFGIDLLDIDLTAFAIFGGAFGLAIGFGLQKTVGNLIAGIILLMDRSIKPGDVIVVGQKDVGWVNKIGVRAVSIVTRDGKEHLIPNENLMTQEVENWSYSDRNVRVRIPVGISYDADLALAQDLMLKAAADSPRVLKSPKPGVWLTAFGDNAVEHEILAWISDPEGGVGNVRSDVLNRLWLLFKEHDVGLPFPQRDVHIRSMPPRGVATGQQTETE